MATPKKYFQDHLVLLLLSINVFLALSAAVFVVLVLTSRHGNGYIVEYRPSLGFNTYKQGGISGLLSFIVFAFLTLAVQVSVSIRSYRINRRLSIIILSLGILLLLLANIIINALQPLQ